MKLLLPFISFIIICDLCNNVRAQTYHLTVSNKPFILLENPQSAVQGPWDVPEFQVPIGFDFKLFDLTSDTLYSFFNSFGGVFEVNLDEDHLYMLLPFYASLIDRGYQQDSALSPINYQTEGLAGQRIFTLEFKEAGLYNGFETENGVFLDYISFQIRLYEDSGDIEFHYGAYSTQEDPDVIFDPYSGPLVGLFADTDWNTFGGNVGEIILLEGNPLKPTVVTDTLPTFLDGPIPENTVYRFSKTTSISDPNSTHENLVISPNPANSFVHLSSSNGRVEIVDAAGRTVYNEYTEEDNLDVSGFAQGIYYLRMISKDKISTGRFVRQ